MDIPTIFTLKKKCYYLLCGLEVETGNQNSGLYFFKRFYPYGSLNWSKAIIFENLDRCSATDDNVTKFKITLNTGNNRCETDFYSSLTFSFVVSQYVFEQRPQSSEEMKFRRAYL